MHIRKRKCAVGKLNLDARRDSQFVHGVGCDCANRLSVHFDILHTIALVRFERERDRFAKMRKRELRLDCTVLSDRQNLTQQFIDILFRSDVSCTEPGVVVGSVTERRVIRVIKPVGHFAAIVIDIVPNDYIAVVQCPILQALIRMLAIDRIHPARLFAVRELAQRIPAHTGGCVDRANVVVFCANVPQACILHSLSKEVINGCVFLQRIRRRGNPCDVFGQIAVGGKVNVLRRFERADQTERDFDIAGLDSIQIRLSLLENIFNPFAGNCGVHILLRGLKDALELLLRGITILFGLVVQQLVIVRLEFLVTFCLSLAENCLVSILGGRQGVVVRDLFLVGGRELIVGVACFCNSVIAVLIDRIKVFDHYDDFLCACVLTLDYIRHIIESFCFFDITVICNECIGALFSRHLVIAAAICGVLETAVLLFIGQEVVQYRITILHKTGIRVGIQAKCAECDNDLRRRFTIRLAPGREPTIVVLHIRQQVKRFVNGCNDFRMLVVVVRCECLNCHCGHIGVRGGAANQPATVRGALVKDCFDQLLAFGVLVVSAVHREERPNRAIAALLLHKGQIVQRGQKVMTAYAGGIFANGSQRKDDTGVLCRFVPRRIELPIRIDICLYIGHNTVVIAVVVAVCDACVTARQTKHRPFAVGRTNLRSGNRLLDVGKRLFQILAIAGVLARIALFQFFKRIQQLLICDRTNLVFLLLRQCIVSCFGFFDLCAIRFCNLVGQRVDQRSNPVNLQLRDLRGCIGDSLPHGSADFGFCAELGKLIQCGLRVCDNLLVGKRQVGGILRKFVRGGCCLGNSSEDGKSLIASLELFEIIRSKISFLLIIQCLIETVCCFDVLCVRKRQLRRSRQTGNECL